MKRIPAALCAVALVLLTACGSAQPTAGVGVNSSGVTGAVGVDTGRTSVGVNTQGNVGVATDVVQGDNVAVSVGASTGGGVGVGVTVGSGPVRVGFGRGGWGFRI